MNISLCMIVKNNEDTIERCLRSIVPFVDEVCMVDTGSTDKTLKIASDVCADLEVLLKVGTWIDPEAHPEKGWISNFAIARQKSVDMAACDLWCWIDSDTRLVNGPAWRTNADRFFENSRGSSAVPGIMHVRYHYELDGHNRVVRVVQAQMVAKRGYFRWEGPVHEMPIAIKGPLDVFDASGEKFEFYLEHFKQKALHSDAAERNAWILENHQKHEREMTDRLWNNLGASYMGCGRYLDAIPAFRKSLEESPEGLEAFSANISLGNCLMSTGDLDAARDAFLDAAYIYPERRAPWVYLAQVALKQQRWQHAIRWADIAEEIPLKADGATYNPSFLRWDPVQTRAKAMREMGHMEEAYAAIKLLSAEFEENPDLARHAREMEDLLQRKHLYVSYRQVADTADPVLAQALWRAAPAQLDVFPEVARAKKPSRPPEKKSMVLMCGDIGRTWSHADLKNGIGGSEEAAILLSQAMARLGWHVEVYGMPPKDDPIFDKHGVAWLPHYAWEDTPTDVFVSWRRVQFCHAAKRADKRWLWLHDVVNPGFYTEHSMASVDGVFCLTDFHAKPLLALPGWRDRVVLTKNGLSDEVLVDPAKYQRRRNSFAFYSSPDRGMDCVLDLWPRIRERLPNATLDLFYGFNDMYLRSMQKLPHLRELKAKIEKHVMALKNDGVKWHGMVSQKAFAENMATTEFWLYPTQWPETFCITSSKSQAMGCIPITSRYPDSGVPETTKFDLGPDPTEYLGGGGIYKNEAWKEAWLEAVLAAACEPPEALSEYRRKMMEWARATFSWDAVAAQWDEVFTKAKEPVCLTA